MTPKFATEKATESRKNVFEAGTGSIQIADGHYRKTQDVWLSSIGIGTYLGNPDRVADEKYKDAIVEYILLGGNVIDTAANYRYQRSERNIGAALKELGPEIDRAELFICTKGGFLSFDGQPSADPLSYFEENYVSNGIAEKEDLVGGSHCMAPGYLRSQVKQSLRNMDLDGLDLFYIHNPESQLKTIDRYLFEARIAKAFEALEESRAEGEIKFYGVASWNGFRVMPDDPVYHSLERFVNIAKQVAGDDNGFKFIQLPHNLAMPEAFLVPNQAANGKALSVLNAASDLGVSAIASASLLQGQLAMNVPFHIRETFGKLTTDAMTSLQFVRSTPGITSSLVGMGSEIHVAENMALSAFAPAPPESFEELFTKAK